LVVAAIVMVVLAIVVIAYVVAGTEGTVWPEAIVGLERGATASSTGRSPVGLVIGD
jgi:hypothetical protein